MNFERGPSMQMPDFLSNISESVDRMTPEERFAAGDALLATAETFAAVEAVGLLFGVGSVTRLPAAENVLIYSLATSAAYLLKTDFTFYVSAVCLGLYSLVTIKGPSKTHKEMLD